jgi:Arc/MetJ-type ribon-helix-helix transcriptional regulator
MTRGVGKYPEEVSVPMTAQMYHFVELLAKRERASKADVIRQAIREHLDVQEDVMGSRSRLGSRIVRQLEQMQGQFLKQQTRAHTLLLAAIILLQMKQGTQGSQVLEQVAQLAAHAGDELQAILEAKE